MVTFSNARSSHQHSLMRLLLNTPDTQTHLLRKILEQLALISLDEEEMLQSQHSQIPRSLFVHLSYLLTIWDSELCFIKVDIDCDAMAEPDRGGGRVDPGPHRHHDRLQQIHPGDLKGVAC